MPAGRWNKYITTVQPKLQQIKNWYRDGATDAEICKRLGIAVSSFNKYKTMYPELVEVMKNGKAEVDYAVENSLLKRALGYSYKETQKITNPDGSVALKETVKQVLPDVTAQIFWLKNRKPAEWRDKHDVDLSAKINILTDKYDSKL